MAEKEPRSWSRFFTGERPLPQPKRFEEEQQRSSVMGFMNRLRIIMRREGVTARRQKRVARYAINELTRNEPVPINRAAKRRKLRRRLGWPVARDDLGK